MNRSLVLGRTIVLSLRKECNVPATFISDSDFPRAPVIYDEVLGQTTDLGQIFPAPAVSTEPSECSVKEQLLF